MQRIAVENARQEGAEDEPEGEALLLSCQHGAPGCSSSWASPRVSPGESRSHASAMDELEALPRDRPSGQEPKLN